MKEFLATVAFPALLAIVGLIALVLWVIGGPMVSIEARVPGLDGAPPPKGTAGLTRPTLGEPVRGPGQPSQIAGQWPWFRGPQHDGRSREGVPLARAWPAGGPKALWTVAVGDGYAAAAVSAGRVYLIDYDVATAADTMRCLSLDDGREIWRNGYHVEISPNHGITRTVPAVAGKWVVSLGPKCHVVGWGADTGKAQWLIDLVLDYGAKVPDWYAGQCPLIDEKLDQLVLAPGGKALVIAVDYATGTVKWQSTNPHHWTMTHSSLVPMDLAGRRMYVYCGSGGVAGIAADSGEILWESTAWQVATACCPSPVPIGDGRIFFCGGYESGAMMLKVEPSGGKFTVRTLYKLTPRQFSSEQQTPVLLDGFLYGVRQKDKQLVCLDLDGQSQWSSGRDKFGAAPYLIADGLLYVLNDKGKLTMLAASPHGPYRPLAQAQVIDDGVDAWGPMALVAGRLIVRDATRLVCLDVAENGPAAAKATTAQSPATVSAEGSK